MDPFDPGSFRDPSGWVFRFDKVLYRQVNLEYQSTYQACCSAGLFDKLWAKGLLVAHQDLGSQLCQTDHGFTVLKPELIPFVSYPYEWSFEALKAAALCTLDVLGVAFENGFVLKDASAYNVQFIGSKPVFIDTLSFERYVADRPWDAYRQFCQHFLAPLYLMAYCDPGIGQLARSYLDGFPLELTSKWLPWKTRLKMGALAHIHLHSRSKSATDGKVAAEHSHRAAPKVSQMGLLGIFDSLRSSILGLRCRYPDSHWKAYYQENNYSDQSMNQKLDLVANMASQIEPKPGIVWDLGANTGRFSRLLAGNCYSVAMDLDPACADIGFLEAGKANSSVLSLVMDMGNPSPALGWGHQERQSLVERGPADLVLSLALIHHLRISANVPMRKIAAFFAKVARNLIIEFVPKEDSQVQRLLQTRPDTFADYTEEEFMLAFSRHFECLEVQELPSSCRKLSLWRRHSCGGGAVCPDQKGDPQ